MRPGVRLAAGFVLLALAGGLAWHFRAQERLPEALDWIERQGAWGWAAFAGLYAAACILMVPGSVLTLGGAAAFGFSKGLLIIWISATLGAAAAFLSGRYLARDLVARKVAADPRFAAIDEAVARQGAKIVLLTRLCPIFPFVLLNYAFGLTKIPLRPFLLASWIGMLPATALFVYAGSLAGDAARGEGTPLGAWGWAARGAGLAIAVWVTVYVGRLARRALQEAAPAAGAPAPRP